MTYLLDTNIMSALVTAKTNAVTDLVDWLDAASAQLFAPLGITARDPFQALPPIPVR